MYINAIFERVGPSRVSKVTTDRPLWVGRLSGGSHPFRSTEFRRKDRVVRGEISERNESFTVLGGGSGPVYFEFRVMVRHPVVGRRKTFRSGGRDTWRSDGRT